MKDKHTLRSSITRAAVRSPLTSCSILETESWIVTTSCYEGGQAEEGKQEDSNFSCKHVIVVDVLVRQAVVRMSESAPLVFISLCLPRNERVDTDP